VSLFACCGTFKALSRAAAKSAAAKLRRAGLLPVKVDWTRRAETCERCPLLVSRKGVSYCGRPFFEQVDRDQAADGCGCPTHEKAKDPSEHCPLNDRHLPARRDEGCDCKWCRLHVGAPATDLRSGII
jgi:hypothetical protein